MGRREAERRDTRTVRPTSLRSGRVCHPRAMPPWLLRARRALAIALPVASLALLAPAAAQSAAPIDFTALPGDGNQLISHFNPTDFDSTGSSVAQTFTAPAGVAKVTTFAARLAAGANATYPAVAPADQPAELELHAVGPLEPENVAVVSRPIVITLDGGAGTVRSFPVDWPVVPGVQYAAVIRIATSVVVAEGRAARCSWRAAPPRSAGAVRRPGASSH